MLHGMRSAPTSLATPSQADTSRGGAGNYAGFSSNYFHSGGSIAGPRQQHTPSSPYADPYSGTLDDALSEDTTGAPGGGPAASAGGSAVPARPQFERIAQRTLLLSNLDPMTTHAEVTRAVRGGMLLEVFLRAADRTASVSFLRSADARAWFEHVKRYDLYIRNKRVSSTTSS